MLWHIDVKQAASGFLVFWRANAKHRKTKGELVA